MSKGYIQEVHYNLSSMTTQDMQKSCFGKVLYTTKNRARDEAKRQTKARGYELHPYHCPVCHLWHLSSIDRKDKPQVRNRQRNKYEREQRQGT